MDTTLFVYGITLGFGGGIISATFWIVLLEGIDHFTERKK